MVKPYLYIETEEDYWVDETNIDAGIGMSGWQTGPDGAFELPYRSDFKFGVGDYTIVQSFVATASGGTRVSTYDDYLTGTGVRFSQLSNTFSVDSGPVTLNLPTNLLDGALQYFMVERESGVAVNAYANDFDTVLATAVDGGADISNTEALGLAYDGTTRMDGLLGLTVVFNRLLQEYEKDDLYYWIESGYYTESEPDWLRTEATLYLNPTDPVQRAEYGARERLINLAVAPPDNIYIRYTFTSVDGVSNPTLTKNHLWFTNLHRDRVDEYDAVENKAIPHRSIGVGEEPLVAKYAGEDDRRVTIPLEELGGTWANGDFTVVFWTRLQADGIAENLLSQDSTGGFAIRDRTDNTVGVYLDNTAVLVSTPVSEAHKKYSMVSVTRSGSNLELSFNGVVDDTAISAATMTLLGDLLYEVPTNGLLGPLHIWTKALTLGQIRALYNASPMSVPVLLEESMTFTDSFATQSFNWERL